MRKGLGQWNEWFLRRFSIFTGASVETQFFFDDLTGTVIGSTTSDQTFTDFGEVKHIGAAFNGAALYAQDVTERDALGRITHLTETVSGAAHNVAYEYDLAGRLKSETRDGTRTAYTYDANGNRTSVQVGSNAAVT